MIWSLIICLMANLLRSMLARFLALNVLDDFKWYLWNVQSAGVTHVSTCYSIRESFET